MAIDFPSSPSIGDNVAVGNVTYTWDNVKWSAVAQIDGRSAITETAQVISANFTLSTGSNGFSVGPVEVAATYAVTVPANATWVIF